MMRCVYCGYGVDGVFIQYSPGNIRLVSCPQCKKPTDEYVECEAIILIIDMILHKPEVYRHLFYNNANFSKIAWKMFSVFLLLDTFISPGISNWDSMTAFSYVIAANSLKAAAIYFQYITLIWIILTRRREKKRSCKLWVDIYLAVTISSYFKLCKAATLVWDFTPLMLLILDILVLTSNGVALRAILGASIKETVVAVAIAAASTLLLKAF